MAFGTLKDAGATSLSAEAGEAAAADELTAIHRYLVSVSKG